MFYKMVRETVVAATFVYRHEAEFARETLRAHGIDAVLFADDAGGAYAGLSFTGQVRLLVHNNDTVRARALLGRDASTPDLEA